jgi:hypothetical protein
MTSHKSPPHLGSGKGQWPSGTVTKIARLASGSYCPELNPVEYHNNWVKEEFYALPAPKDKLELSSNVNNIYMGHRNIPDKVKKLFNKEEVVYARKSSDCSIKSLKLLPRINFRGNKSN